MNAKQKMYAQILKHGENLKSIFKIDLDPIKLCKSLRRLENKATTLTTAQCNTGADHSIELEKIKSNVCKLLNATPEQKAAIFINGDPRGYALKVSDKFMRSQSINLHTDLGGYGILAPDFSPYK